LILSVLRVEQKNTGLKVEREISRKKDEKDGIALLEQMKIW
jgi:hypothetical protein